MRKVILLMLVSLLFWVTACSKPKPVDSAQTIEEPETEVEEVQEEPTYMTEKVGDLLFDVPTNVYRGINNSDTHKSYTSLSLDIGCSKEEAWATQNNEALAREYHDCIAYEVGGLKGYYYKETNLDGEVNFCSATFPVDGITYWVEGVNEETFDALLKTLRLDN